MLRPGDRLSQEEFHRRYQAYPEDAKFELVDGVVYMASPLGQPHALHNPELTGALWLYKAYTPGVEALENATTILGLASEPQPDLALRIAPDWGGQSGMEGKYVKGAPELLAEVADSSLALDLGQKKRDYRRAGVVEYIVWCVEERQLHWFDFAADTKITPTRQGVLRSRVFPGLWIHRHALLERDSRRVIKVLQRGLASRAHAAFVKRLQAEHGKA